MSDSAIQTFNLLVRQNPQNPRFHYHLGQALFDKGDKSSAKKEFENALCEPRFPRGCGKAERASRRHARLVFAGKLRRAAKP
jgi:TolA-binding protein